MRFVLVHGALHGAWCWDRLIPELEGRGCEAVAIDLPGHGHRRSEAATLESYRQALVDVVEEGDILVGHSMGGTVITLAADVLGDKVRHLVYVAAPVPLDGHSLSELTPTFSGMSGLEFSQTEFWIKDVDSLATAFYHDCDRGTCEWVFERLQPQAIEPIVTPVRLESFGTSKVPRALIACLDDRTPTLMDVEASLTRLGVRSAYPMWASHSPFMSRPGDLATLLGEVVADA